MLKLIETDMNDLYDMQGKTTCSQMKFKLIELTVPSAEIMSPASISIKTGKKLKSIEEIVEFLHDIGKQLQAF